MLPRALYGDISWQDALEKILAAPSAKVISAGRVADKQFFVAAVVGAPTFGQKPENLYVKEILLMLSKRGASLSKSMFKTKVQYLISAGMKGEAEAVAVICPLVSEENVRFRAST